MGAQIADDLFAGAGGWDLAAAALGIHARGIENMKEARATRDAAGLTTIHDDVWTYQPDGNAEGLIASPPCQTFSAAGKGSGRKALDDVLRGINDYYYADLDHLRFLGEEVGDNRTSLVLTPLHFAMKGHGYRWLAWEQVPTVLPVWEACAAVLRKHGWSVWTGLLQAEMFGVPQTRKRAFLLANRDRHVEPPSPTHSRYYSRTPDKLDPGVRKWVSMADALGWGLSERPSPTVTGGGVETGGAEPIAKLDRYITRADWVLRGSNQAKAAIRPMDHPASTMLFGHCSNDVRWYRAGTTTRGVPEPAGERHPDPQRVSVDEAGILQSFPAGYAWQGGQSKQFLQAGNAVPPGLAIHGLASAARISAEERAA